jgi:hypothetical protein
MGMMSSLTYGNSISGSGVVKYEADSSTSEVAYGGTVPLTILRILQIAFSPEEVN